MPLIQELPNTSAQAATPGWAYVPDTGFDPSKAPIIPTNRKRQSAARALLSTPGAASPYTDNSDGLSSRAQNKIAKHITELERENHKDVKIEVPNRPRDVGSRSIHKNGKMTTNVKRVLQSQKTWANHLADEEALVTQGVGAHPIIESGLREQRESGTPAVSTSKRASIGAAGRRKSASAAKNDDADAMEIDSTPVPTLEPAKPENSQPGQHHQQQQQQLEDPKIDHLVKIELLKMPTPAEIEALLSQPPLSFNAARAAPSASTMPARKFCEMCGYWGRAICMKCGARVCGLDCKLAHEETSCQRFYG